MGGKIRLSVFAAIILLAAEVSLGIDDAKILEFRGKTMGTTYLVKFEFRQPNPTNVPYDVEKVRQAVERRLAEINLSMSTYIRESEITRFNESQSTDSFDVSADFLKVAARAIQLHQLTEGGLDVTVGPLVRFWGFGGGQPPDKIPTQAQVASVLGRVGSRHLKVAQTSIQKSIQDLEVDFSALAKGYAVDEVGEILDSYADNYMVEIGGEVRTHGLNPESGRSWAIGIELPQHNLLDSSRELAARVELADQALATSGDYRNFVFIEGKKFQHTIDPNSGFPVDRGILSVSVVADDCMTADGLATGLMVKTLDEIKSISSTKKLGVFVMFRNREGVVEPWKSEQFPGEVFLGKNENSVASSAKEGPAKTKTNPLYLILGTVVVFGLAISGMAIGVIMSNRQLKGSCGGLSAMNENEDADASPCSLCTKPASECSKRSGQESPESASPESTSPESA